MNIVCFSKILFTKFERKDEASQSVTTIHYRRGKEEVKKQNKILHAAFAFTKAPKSQVNSKSVKQSINQPNNQ